MPKPTIKSLEEQIKTLRELRECDARTAERDRYELSDTKQRLVESHEVNKALREDKGWLLRIVNNLTQVK